jgi:hypothetical protein
MFVMVRSERVRMRVSRSVGGEVGAICVSMARVAVLMRPFVNRCRQRHRFLVPRMRLVMVHSAHEKANS